MELPRVNEVLEGGFWQEPVRVLTVQSLGQLVRLEAVGTKTQQFYSRVFTPADPMCSSARRLLRDLLAYPPRCAHAPHQDGADLHIEVLLQARSKEGITKRTLQEKVKETLRQINAKVVEEQVEE